MFKNSLFYSLSFVSLLTGSATAAVVNGGFEDGTTSPAGWGTQPSSRATFTHITGGVAGDTVHSGSSAVQISGSSHNSARWFSTNFALVAGETYTASVWVKPQDIQRDAATEFGNANGNDVYRMEVDFFLAGGAAAGDAKTPDYAYVSAENGLWRQLTLEFAVPTNVVEGQVLLILDGALNTSDSTANASVDPDSRITFDDVAVVVPEPSALGLMGLGLLAVAGGRRRA